MTRSHPLFVASHTQSASWATTVTAMFVLSLLQGCEEQLEGVSAREMMACSGEGQNCQEDFCPTGLTCYVKDESWAACRRECEPGTVYECDDPQYKTPWSCEVLWDDPTCSREGQNCQDSPCADGLNCYVKNEHWAGCRNDCEPGSVYECDHPDFKTEWSCELHDVPQVLYIVGVWEPLHSISSSVGTDTYTLTIGTRSTLLGVSSKANVAREMNVQMYGSLGRAKALTKELSAEQFNSYNEEWNTFETEWSLELTATPSESYLWQWIHCSQDGCVRTKSYAMTAGRSENPKCLPGYALDAPKYQRCVSLMTSIR